MSGFLSYLAGLDWPVWFFGIGFIVSFTWAILDAWNKWRSKRRAPNRVPTPAAPVPKVVNIVDPEQSQVSYFNGPSGLQVALFLTIENHLDIDCRMKTLALDFNVTRERLECRYYEFLPPGKTHGIKEVGGLCVKARDSIEGWARFGYTDDVIPLANLRRFTLTAQGIGEPEQRQYFSIFDHLSARNGPSKIVMLPCGS